MPSRPLCASNCSMRSAGTTPIPAVRVTIVRGAGVCFSAGYDLGGGPMMEGAPFYSAPGDGQWARQANDTLVQHLGLGQAGHRADPRLRHRGRHRAGLGLRSGLRGPMTRRSATRLVRVLSPPDWQYHTVLLGLRRAMELMLTGDPISGVGSGGRSGSPIGPSRPDRLRSRCWPSQGGWPAFRAISPRSTSAACTAPSTCGAPAPAIRAGTELQGWRRTPRRRQSRRGGAPRTDQGRDAPGVSCAA